MSRRDQCQTAESARSQEQVVEALVEGEGADDRGLLGLPRDDKRAQFWAERAKSKQR